MNTFKIGDRVNAHKDWGFGSGTGTGTITLKHEHPSPIYDWSVKLDSGKTWAYHESELTLLENTPETYNGYELLRPITSKELILAGAGDEDTHYLLRTAPLIDGTKGYCLNEKIPLTVAIDYCTEGNHACPEKLQWLEDNTQWRKEGDRFSGFVEKVVDEMKPCPFCGGEAGWVTHEKNWIYCEVCRADGRPWETSEEALEAWNKRA